jgi:hypothetical protein
MVTKESDFSHTALPRIEREGDRLIVLRGVDFSEYCFRCARESVGGPIVKYLKIDKSGAFHRPGQLAGGEGLFILDVLEFLLWLVWWVADWPKSRHRRISFGLCAEHRRRRFLSRPFTTLGIPIGFVLVIFGIFGDLPDPMNAIPIASGVALACLGMILAGYGKEPKLAGENDRYLWIKGAGHPFLDRQKPRTAAGPNSP